MTPEEGFEIDPTDYLIYVTGDVTQQLADNISRVMFALNYQNLTMGILHPITLMVNSGGGELHAGWQICDMMDMIETPVETVGLGQVASAALMIFMNGETRTLTDRCSVMSHRYSWGAAGGHHDLISIGDEFRYAYERVIKHYEECTGLNRKEIEQNLLCEHDVWLTAKDAKKFNLTDEIQTTKKTKNLRKKKNGRTRKPTTRKPNTTK
jgi:ATP-dependent Clp protease protease subunit